MNEREVEARLATLSEFMYRAPIGMVQANADGVIELINPVATRLLAPLAPDGRLVNLFDLLSPMIEDLREIVETADRPDGRIFEALRVTAPQLAREGGPPRTLAITLVSLEDARLMATISDDSAAIELEERRLASSLRQAARTDGLTAMPNRTVMLDRLGAALAARALGARTGFAVLLVDCDRFSRVNDTYGRTVGDAMLRMMGRRLEHLVRAGDTVTGPPVSGGTLAARLGGNEFVVLLENVRDPDVIGRVGRRIVDALGEPYGIDTHLIHTTASVGIVTSEEAEGDADAVLQAASIAMHEAKRDGGGRCIRYCASMGELAARRGTIENELHIALSNRELFVVYQPFVSMADGRVAGVEALVRWRHPVRGVLPPGYFIEVAEESGLIGLLGEFVLGEACRQMAQWIDQQGAAAPPLLAVNLSRTQLGDPTLAAQVAGILEREGLPAARLQLEVTESQAAQDETVQQRLRELKALGVTLALDDFGTGYSSLSSLHQLPVDVVKIDRSFVSQLESSPHHRVLIEATVLVAKSLGMGTVAEGIETPAQYDALAGGLGIDKGQGYLISRPLGADELLRWLDARTADRLVERATCAN
ncbi:MAG: putative bifunctional diguanylate cyclase/phosphodiesterase [Lautropia sp.]